MDLREIILGKLDALDMEYTLHNNDQYAKTTCLNPSHDDSKPSFWVALDSGFGQCWTCKFNTGVEYWTTGLTDEDIEELERLSIYTTLRHKELTSQGMIEYNPYFMPPPDEPMQDGWRGISIKLMDLLGMYTTRTGFYEDRIIFPLKEEVLYGFDSRYIGEDEDIMKKAKYRRSKGINDIDLVYPYALLKAEMPDKIYLVEGIMDAISMWEMGLPAIPMFGLAKEVTSKKIAKLIRLGVEFIVPLPDNDEYGKEAIPLIEEMYQEHFEVILPHKDSFGIKFLTSGVKDPNEYLVKVYNLPE